MNNGTNDCQRISRRVVLTGTARALGAAAAATAVSRGPSFAHAVLTTKVLLAQLPAPVGATAGPGSWRSAVPRPARPGGAPTRETPGSEPRRPRWRSARGAAA